MKVVRDSVEIRVSAISCRPSAPSAVAASIPQEVIGSAGYAGCVGGSILSRLKTLTVNSDRLKPSRTIHGVIVSNGLDSVSVFGDYLIRLYSSIHGNLEASAQVFIRIPHPSIYTWNAIISAHAKLGEESSAMALFYRMMDKDHHIKPNRITFLTLLKKCHGCDPRARIEGMILHDYIFRTEHIADVAILNTIIDMYAKCGCLTEAYSIFDKLPFKDLVTWSVMISGYAHLGFGLNALELLEKMIESGLQPCKITYLSALKACCNIQQVRYAHLLHTHIVLSGLESEINLGTSLVDMYCKCCNLVDAHRVFDQLPIRNVVTWSSIIIGYMHEGLYTTCLQFFTQMQQEDIAPDVIVFSNVLKACSNLKALEQGRLVHKQIRKSGFAIEIALAVDLVEFYGRCRSLEEAHSVFDTVPRRNVMLWAALISVYVGCGPEETAFQLFERMNCEGIDPNMSIFLSMAKACGNLRAITHGRLIHDQILKHDYDKDPVLSTSMIDMYMKCGSLQEAYRMFKTLPNQDVVSWSAIISGYVEHDDATHVMKIYREMQQLGITPDRVTFLCMLKASSNIGSITHGMVIHEEVIRLELDSDIMVGNSMVDMYVKCGSLKAAHNVLDRLPVRTVISWSSLIIGYVEHQHCFTALELFERMQQEHVRPNEVTLLYLLKACGSIGAIEIGRRLHDEIIREGFTLDVVLGSAVVDMYAGSGCIKEALSIFELVPCEDCALWSAIISGYAQQGHYEHVFLCLRIMLKQGVKPNAAIFASILSACSNAGLIVEGWHYFNDMKTYSLIPSMEHYSCMVYLLGRTGCLNSATSLIRSMPFSPDVTLWTSLLTSCNIHGNYDLGRYCFNKGVNLDMNDASLYVLASNSSSIYQQHKHTCHMEDCEL